MTHAESLLLDPGIYRLYWHSGGSSLAAVGMTIEGWRWMAPINWVMPSAMPRCWASVVRAERIDQTPPAYGGGGGGSYAGHDFRAITTGDLAPSAGGGGVEALLARPHTFAKGER